jgi:carbon storage regulator
MLVLSRRCDAAIQIGRDIRVMVLAIRKNQVQLGIEAPRDICIWRDELCYGDPRLFENENICANEPAQVRKM